MWGDSGGLFYDDDERVYIIQHREEAANEPKRNGEFVKRRWRICPETYNTTLHPSPTLFFSFSHKLHMPRPIVHPKVTYTNRAGRGGSLNLSTEGGVFVAEGGRCRDNTSGSAPATHQFGKRRWRVMLTKSLVITTKHDYNCLLSPPQCTL